MEKAWDLETLAQWRGKHVVTSDQKAVGTLEDIVSDRATGEPLWVGLATGLFGAKLILAPAASVEAEGDHLRVAHSHDHLEGEPPVELGEGWSYGEDAVRLYQYFGMRVDPAADISVLHRHDDLPGLERVRDPHGA